MEPLKLVKYALDSTISLINKGEEPTSALEKISRDLDLNPNYIQRVGEALNVALHFNHFTKSASDRAVDFPVANIPNITKSIFGETEKTLNEKKSEWFRKIPQNVNYNKYLTDSKFKKTASEIEKTNANFDSFGISLKGQYKKAADYISSLEKDLDALRTNKVANDAYLEAAFNNLVKGFKKSAQARIPFHEFETQAYVEYGDRATGYVDLIYKAAELKEPRGAKDKGRINFKKSREVEILGSLLKSASAVNRFKEELNDAETFTSFQRSSFKQAGYKMHKAAGLKEKEANEELADDLGDILEKVGTGALTGSLVQDLYSQLSDAAYGRDKKSPTFKNTSMDNMERTTLLQDLIMTDPILSKQDPRKIITAYQQILRLAPHLAKEKEVVRSLLKGITAVQGIDPMEANQLVEGNTNYLKQHQMLHSTEDDHNKKKK